MEKPKAAANSPVIIEVEKGKNYAWCACGQSENQPWCNGMHKDSGFTPNVFQAEESRTVALCMCKQTKNPPYCDGTHKRL